MLYKTLKTKQFCIWHSYESMDDREPHDHKTVKENTVIHCIEFKTIPFSGRDGKPDDIAIRILASNFHGWIKLESDEYKNSLIQVTDSCQSEKP